MHDRAAASRRRLPATSHTKAAQAIKASAHSCGSGTVGTVNRLTGVRRCASNCCLLSSTTAPLTGVTNWDPAASATAAARLAAGLVRISVITRSRAHSRAT
jgi:hypothetical protein